jgi:hypothetical protein
MIPHGPVTAQKLQLQPVKRRTDLDFTAGALGQTGPVFLGWPRQSLIIDDAAREVQPAADGRSVVWTLQFRSREQHHRFIDATPDGAERAEVHKLIAAGMRLHHIVGCSPQETAVTKLGAGGVAFVGTCPVVAHAASAGGI